MSHNRGFLTELELNLRAAYARAWVRIVGGNREPVWIAFEVILPILTLSAYVFVYRVLNAPPEFTGFVVPDQLRSPALGTRRCLPTLQHSYRIH